MFDRVQAKQFAREQFSGDLILLCFIYFLPTLIALALTTLTAGFGSIVAFVLAPMLALGVCLVFLNRAQGHQYKIEQVFAYLQQWWRAFALFFLVGLFVWLWSLLLVIPGIIAGYRYSMAYFIMAEHPDMTAGEALAASKELTQGQVWDLFMLDLSMIGWYVLVACTSGIASLWVLPYRQAVMTNVYLMLKETKCY